MVQWELRELASIPGSASCDPLDKSLSGSVTRFSHQRNRDCKSTPSSRDENCYLSAYDCYYHTHPRVAAFRAFALAPVPTSQRAGQGLRHPENEQQLTLKQTVLGENKKG